MSKIQLLDQNTINQIAAGEVVERPASIVKELVENSIDAKASAITIEIKEGGISFIRITDNGVGIEKKDIDLAFLRHSTSKIRSVEDLGSISSLGFRGEALASISSVSQVELITKTYNDITGIRYVIEGGEEKSLEEIGCPEGTTFIIKNLFYNTPARRKFLKKPGTEAGYIGELVNKLALGNPHISFKFIYNNVVKLHTSGNNMLKDSIFNVYGKEITKNLIPIKCRFDNFEIKGFIGKPQIGRANRNYENYFINGRYIRSKIIQKAIEDGYKSLLTVHRYPFTVLDININLDLIDVNVHPTKMEIRFKNENEIYDNLKKAIEQALRSTDLIPEVSLDKKKNQEIKYVKKNIPEPFEKNRIKIKPNFINEKPLDSSYKPGTTTASSNSIKGNLKKEKENIATSLPKVDVNNQLIDIEDKIINEQPINEKEKTKLISESNAEQVELIEQGFIDKNSIKEHKVVGQLFNTYWIVELKDKYYLIDQHAAHERVLYERIINDIKQSKLMSQPLLQPTIINISMKEKHLIEEYLDVFHELGFEMEDFGGDAYAIRSVPYIFDHAIKPDSFVEILDNISDGYSKAKHDIILDKIATSACKAAVKAHDKMSLREYEKLLDELLKLDNPYTCPHGRPTIISMTRYELEKKFKRIQ